MRLIAPFELADGVPAVPEAQLPSSITDDPFGDAAHRDEDAGLPARAVALAIMRHVDSRCAAALMLRRGAEGRDSATPDAAITDMRVPFAVELTPANFNALRSLLAALARHYATGSPSTDEAAECAAGPQVCVCVCVWGGGGLFGRAQGQAPCATQCI